MRFLPEPNEGMHEGGCLEKVQGGLISCRRRILLTNGGSGLTGQPQVNALSMTLIASLHWNISSCSTNRIPVVLSGMKLNDAIFGQSIKPLRELVYREVLRITRNIQDAADAQQETSVKGAPKAQSIRRAFTFYYLDHTDRSKRSTYVSS